MLRLRCAGGSRTIRAAAVRRGSAGLSGAGRHWHGMAGTVDAFDAKADALALLGSLGVPTGGLQITAGGPSWLHPGRSGTLRFGPKTEIGWFGEVHPRTLQALDLKGTLVAFEIVLDALPLPKHKPTKAKGRPGAVGAPAAVAGLRLRGWPRRAGG